MRSLLVTLGVFVCMVLGVASAHAVTLHPFPPAREGLWGSQPQGQPRLLRGTHDCSRLRAGAVQRRGH